MKGSYLLPAILLCSIAVGCKSSRNIDYKAMLSSYEITLTDATSMDTTVTKVIEDVHPDGSRAGLLSAFFGLDDALPPTVNVLIHEGTAGKDGIPVVFSHEIAFSTLQAGDFRVTAASGKIGETICVTLAPADDMGELRTVLIVGQFGSIDDQPTKVEVVGNLLSKDQQVNFKGKSTHVIPLEVGPSLVLAETVPEDEWEIGKEATPLFFGGGSGCPQGTKQVVRATWEGGVTKPGGAEIDDTERMQYKVTVQKKDGTIVEVTPFAIADMGDGDNNHRLCLDVEGAPKSISFPAGYLTDPREDLNPETSIMVTK